MVLSALQVAAGADCGFDLHDASTRSRPPCFRGQVFGPSSRGGKGDGQLDAQLESSVWPEVYLRGNFGIAR
jgi:hypothetical protein